MEEAGINSDYDDLDRKIARIMSQEGYLTSVVLGEIVGLSVSAVNERVRKLKNSGKIRKIAAFVSSEFMNLQLCAFLFFQKPENEKQFLDFVENDLHIMECHKITGEYSYMLKIRVSSMKMLDKFVEDVLRPKIGEARLLTQIVTRSIKEESVVVE